MRKISKITQRVRVFKTKIFPLKGKGLEIISGVINKVITALKEKKLDIQSQIINDENIYYRIALALTDEEKLSCVKVIKENFRPVENHWQNERQLQEYLYITKRIDASKSNGNVLKPKFHVDVVKDIEDKLSECKTNDDIDNVFNQNKETINGLSERNKKTLEASFKAMRSTVL